MSSKNIKPRELSPQMVTEVFSGIGSPKGRTAYYNRLMTNPETSDRNISLARQFRAQNPDLFLSEAEEAALAKRPGGSPTSHVSRRRLSGGFKPKDRSFDSDGYSYDRNGIRYDRRGQPDGAFNDGGADYTERPPRQDGGGFYTSDVYNRVRDGSFFASGRSGGKGGRRRRDPRVAVTESEIGETIIGLSDPVRRSQYFRKVLDNPESNEETVRNLVSFRKKNEALFASDEVMMSLPEKKPRGSGDLNGWSYGGNGRMRYVGKGGDRGRDGNARDVAGNGDGRYVYKGPRYEKASTSYSFADIPPEEIRGMYVSAEDFERMSPKERKFFTGSMKRANRAKNTAYATRVYSNPTSADADKAALSSIVNSKPELFFASRGQRRRA